MNLKIIELTLFFEYLESVGGKQIFFVRVSNSVAKIGWPSKLDITSLTCNC